MVSRGTPGTELRRSHLSSSELPSPHGRLSVLAEIGHSPFQNGPLLNGTIPGQADWTRLRPQCRARRPRRGALPLPPSGVLNYIGLSSLLRRWLQFKHKTRRRKGGTYPLPHLYGHFGLVRLSRLGHDVPWVKA